MGVLDIPNDMDPGPPVQAPFGGPADWTDPDALLALAEKRLHAPRRRAAD